MKCALVRWWMEEYIDGALQGRRLQWVEKHLQECSACAQELAWHRLLCLDEHPVHRADLGEKPGQLVGVHVAAGDGHVVDDFEPRAVEKCDSPG